MAVHLTPGARWLISVPIWGEVYARTFARVAAPALLAAVRRLRLPVRFIVHTDLPDAVRAALPGQDVDVRPVPNKPTYVTLQESHIDAVAAAEPGDRVVLLNADLVVSGNLLLRCGEHFARGDRAVVLLGIRTAAGDEVPPVGAAPRDLLAWAWDHRHQIVRDLEYPEGGSMLPTNLFFRSGDSVVARGFHLHPVAIVKDADVRFRSTIDGDLLDCFPRDSIRVVTSPDDCAMLEVSEPTRRFPTRAAHLSPPRIAASMRTRASATHKWLFLHRILVRGRLQDIEEDVGVARQVLAHMSEPAGSSARGRYPRPREWGGVR